MLFLNRVLVPTTRNLATRRRTARFRRGYVATQEDDFDCIYLTESDPVVTQYALSPGLHWVSPLSHIRTTHPGDEVLQPILRRQQGGSPKFWADPERYVFG
jgi:hypothetical protein